MNDSKKFFYFKIFFQLFDRFFEFTEKIQKKIFFSKKLSFIELLLHKSSVIFENFQDLDT